MKEDFLVHNGKLFDIKKVRKPIYNCEICHRKINNGEYALYQGKYASVCITHTPVYIDKIIARYSKVLDNANDAIKHLLNDDDDLIQEKRAVKHYKMRIKELKVLKKLYEKNKDKFIDRSIVANI